jgi:hypothetical protein
VPDTAHEPAAAPSAAAVFGLCRMLFPVNSQQGLGRFVLPASHAEIHFNLAKLRKIHFGNNLTRFASTPT